MSPELGPVMMDLRGPTIESDEREMLVHPLVGGLILFTRNYENPEQLAALVREIRALRDPILIAADTEGGRVQRFRDGFFALPAMGQYGDRYDRDPEAGLAAAHAGGWMLAAELRAVDIDLAFAPVLDLDGGVSAIIGDRALHQEPEAVIALAEAVCAGMEEAGMAATGKHFPGHGNVAPDSHVELPVDSRSAESIEDHDMLPFARLAAKLPSVMMAHIRYPAVDDLPASMSSRWIQGILRDRLHHFGAVFCDDLSMGGALDCGDIVERSRLALEAGCDMLPVCNNCADVQTLLDQGLPDLEHSAVGRLLALRGRPAPDLAELRKADAYTQAQTILSELKQDE